MTCFLSWFSAEHYGKQTRALALGAALSDDFFALDSGAPGLQITSTGEPKVIDIVDGSGDGDVDTSKIVQCDAEGWITGCTGKKMKVNPEWTNPSGKPCMVT